MIQAPFSFVLLVVGAYVSGAIPFALIVSKSKGIDLRKVGSGNFGATNVYRAMGLPAALLVFGLDALKGAFPVLLTMALFESPVIHIIVGATAIIGHTFSLFLGFKGGKGAATALGVFMVFSPIPMSITIVGALLILVLFRMVSLATITACVCLPVLMVVFDEPKAIVYMVSVVAFYIVIKHRANIQRILAGKEHKI